MNRLRSAKFGSAKPSPDEVRNAIPPRILRAGPAREFQKIPTVGYISENQPVSKRHENVFICLPTIPRGLFSIFSVSLLFMDTLMHLLIRSIAFPSFGKTYPFLSLWGAWGWVHAAVRSREAMLFTAGMYKKYPHQQLILRDDRRRFQGGRRGFTSSEGTR